MPERVAIVVERLGISVAKVAFLVNQARVADGLEPISDQGVGLWLKGGREPGVEDLRRLAKVLECDPGWLAFGKDSAAPAPAWLHEMGKGPTGKTLGAAHPGAGVQVLKDLGKGRRDQPRKGRTG